MDQELRNLYRFIDDNWEPNTSSAEKRLVWFRNVRVYQTDEEEISRLGNNSFGKCVQKSLCDSSFFNTLKNRKWMLAECGRYSISSNSNKIEPLIEIKSKIPREIFFKDNLRFQQLYGLHASYSMNVLSRDKSNLGVDLGKVYVAKKYFIFLTYKLNFILRC